MTGIIYASIIAAVLTAPMLRLLGISWLWSWAISLFGAGFIGACAAESLGYF